MRKGLKRKGKTGKDGDDKERGVLGRGKGNIWGVKGKWELRERQGMS